jgi:hypothetical protein
MSNESNAVKVVAKPRKLRVEEALIQKHAEMASRSFAEHVVTQRLNDGMFRSWRCQKLGSWIHGFNITTTPGHLIVTGDIGDLIVTRTADMIAWAREAIHDPGYFAEKVPSSIPTREWSYDRPCE